ncbi:nitrate- and nitrite sensing domain-containing protein [Kitasatospora paranensis]|uniref:nitrate- and nitrite sensing domain-containing protein n=1 Tax=Kitasatospora paranensis TaxID=258053 RepID=UPI00361AC5E8
MALAALWAVASGQLLLDFQRQAAQGLLAQKAGQPSNIVYYSLQEERRLSAETLARHSGPDDALRAQRVKTDQAIVQFQTLSDVEASDAPAEVRQAVQRARQAIGQLPAQRTLVDGGGSEQQAAVYRYYTDLIAVDLQLFSALSHVDNGRVTTLSQPLVDLFWTKEMISRSDALLARGWADGSLSADDYQQFRQSVDDQPFQYGTKVAPYLAPDEAAMWQRIANGPAWQTKTRLEQSLLKPVAADKSGRIPLDGDRQAWRQAMDQLTPQLVDLLEHRTAAVVDEGKGSIMDLLLKLVLTTVIGLLAVVAVVITSWRLTRTLRRRIVRLQEQARDLERSLPDVVARLGQGEQIDVEEQAKAIPRDPWARTEDELAELGEALNLARTSALQAAVAQAEQHRGFERLLQRIARRTQLLIGQQLKKLDELERRHEDPEILDGLFDLDHLTARLRRYEENLVILAGGTPHRRWRKPVPLLDVIRAAQGEVQDYRRVVIDLDGSPWLSERAVGPVAHVIAELIENALAFSRPPSPVEVRAGRVSRGVAIEVEDRGLGMDDEQLAEANDLMSRPPRTDVLARGDDIRLGFYVIARLADQNGLRIEFRQSAFGGTRVVVLVPDELIVPDPLGRPVAVPPLVEAATLPTRSRGRALAGVTSLPTPALTAAEPGPYPDGTAYPDGDPYPSVEGPGLPADPFAPAARHTGGEPEPLPADPYGSPYGDSGRGAGPAHGHSPYTLPEPYRPVPVTAADWPAAPPVPTIEPLPAAPPVPTVEPLPAAVVLPAPAEPAQAGPGNEPPLPRRVRQASLVDELRVTPADRSATPRPPRWDENPLFRPAPRRAGAAIGAFQRRSRAARTGDLPAGPGGSPADDTWNTPPIPTREDRS